MVAFRLRMARLEFVVSLWEKPIMWRSGAWMNQFGRREEFSRVFLGVLEIILFHSLP